MKKLSKILLFISAGVIVVPIFSIFFHSFMNTGVHPFSWYSEVLKNQDFLSALSLSVGVSILVAFVSTIVSFFLSLAWFNKKQHYYVVILVVILGLIPPDILALGISKLSQTLEWHNSNLLFTVFGLMLYCLPYLVLILWVRYYFIDNEIIQSAKDIGMNNLNINFKIIFLLSIPNIISAFIFCVILSLNEYPRTYYLSGHHTFLSEYLFGKLGSGANESIYAGSGLTILITFGLVLLTFILFKLLKSKKATIESI